MSRGMRFSIQVCSSYLRSWPVSPARNCVLLHLGGKESVVKHYRIINRLGQHILFDEDPLTNGFSGHVEQVETENHDWLRGPDGVVRLDITGHPQDDDRRYRYFRSEDECAAAGYVLV